LYLSGLFGSQDGTLAKGLDEQVHQLAKNHTAVLAGAGLSLEDIVSGHVYYGDRNAMKAARHWITPMVPLHRFVMHNNRGTRQTLMEAFGKNSRVDLRLVEDNGRVFGVTKQRGIIFEIFPTRAR
jgi:enamine deaminase RidA (YjgF/YER057c/UK114 family)